MLGQKQKNALRWMISAAITLVLLFFLSKQISLAKIPGIFSRISWGWFALTLFVYYASTLVRARRFQALGISGLPLWKLANISFIHYFLSNLLPFRSGELSFIYLVNKDRAASLPTNVSALVLARIFDFLAVIVWLVLSILVLFPERLSNLDPIVLAAFGTLLVLLLALNVLLFGRSLLGRLIGYCLRFFHARFPGFESRFSAGWQELGRALDILKDKKILARVLFYSLAGWFLLYLLTILFLRSIGLTLGFWPSVFVTSFPPIASLIPLGTFGNFGTVEAGWAFGFTIVGFSLETALTLSLTMHVLTLLMQCVMASSAWLVRRRWR